MPGRAECDRDTDTETNQAGTVGLVRQSNPRLHKKDSGEAGELHRAQRLSWGGGGQRPLPEGDACAKAQGERGRLGRGAGGKAPTREGRPGGLCEVHFGVSLHSLGDLDHWGLRYHSHSLLLMIGKILKADAC